MHIDTINMDLSICFLRGHRLKFLNLCWLFASMQTVQTWSAAVECLTQTEGPWVRPSPASLGCGP